VYLRFQNYCYLLSCKEAGFLSAFGVQNYAKADHSQIEHFVGIPTGTKSAQSEWSPNVNGRYMESGSDEIFRNSRYFNWPVA